MSGSLSYAGRILNREITSVLKDERLRLFFLVEKGIFEYMYVFTRPLRQREVKSKSKSRSLFFLTKSVFSGSIFESFVINNT